MDDPFRERKGIAGSRDLERLLCNRRNRMPRVIAPFERYDGLLTFSLTIESA